MVDVGTGLVVEVGGLAEGRRPQKGVEDDIVDSLRTLGVKSLIKDGTGCPVLRERARSLCENAKMACVIMPYEIVNSISQVLGDLSQFLSCTSVLILLSWEVDPGSLFLSVLEG